VPTTAVPTTVAPSSVASTSVTAADPAADPNGPTDPNGMTDADGSSTPSDVGPVTLAYTGGSSSLLAVLGIGLACIGSVLTVGARRRAAVFDTLTD
jgi:hypothetical protein